MAADIFLIAPPDADIANFPAMLAPALASTKIAALFLPKGTRTNEAYTTFAETIIPIAQKRDCAVLLDNDFALAKKLGADGVHMSTGLKNFQEALQALKPDRIVGAGAIHSRHDAMAKAEAGADYIFFDNDNPDMALSIAQQASWWAETFEIPCVMQITDPSQFAGCPGEFIALGEIVWSAPEGPPSILTAAAASLQETKA